MSSVKEILTHLVERPSITPDDGGCQQYMMDYLEKLGFQCQTCDAPPVSNFFACIGQGDPFLIFAGHTDVVPVGEKEKWSSNPFVLHEQEGMLYGRGTADMKGSLACMLFAAKNFLHEHPSFQGRLGFLITSGEEGDQFDLGTPFVMKALSEQNIKPDYCIVGEPSSTHRAGDVIKIGRRGSLTAKAVLTGKQGHVAYPHLAQNPIHQLSPALTELIGIKWDEGNAHFPSTTMQITHIQSGGQANNIIPGELILQLNFRYSTELLADDLKQAVEACFKRYDLQIKIDWKLNGEPFLTSHGNLLNHTVAAIQYVTGQTPELSTSGGTSDGRFIAPYGVEVVELGPVNATIHQVNECVSAADLDTLAELYQSICERLLT